MNNELSYLEQVRQIMDLQKQGLKRSEIARRLGLSERQVKRRIERYHRMKRQALGNLVGRFQASVLPSPSDDWLEQYVYQPEIEEEATRQAEGMTLKQGLRDILHVSDLHVPFHEPKAIEFAMDYAKRHDVRVLIINGDFFDFHDLSDFVKEGMIGIHTEINYGQKLLKYLLSESSPFEVIILISGNHDRRLWSYVASKAPNVLGAISVDLLDTLTEPFSNVLYAKNWYLKIGTVIFAHPTKYYSVPGKTVREVSNFFTRYNIHHTGLVIGHTHHMVHMIDGYKWLAESGCMQRVMRWKLDGNLPGPPWTHGFAHIRLDENGDVDWLASRVIPIHHNLLKS